MLEGPRQLPKSYNLDDFPHNVTLLTGPDRTSKDVGIGDSVSLPFADAGTV